MTSKKLGQIVAFDRQVILIGAALAGAMAFADCAAADVVVADWTDDEHFDYQIKYMPDLDQERNGLSSNGDSHCVPTATMNMLAYAAEWGIESMDPGPGVYTGDVGYNTMTNYIDQLGDLMGTNITCTGTCLDGWIDGTEEWTDGFPLVTVAWWNVEGQCPTISDMAQAASNGALVSFAYGRYNFNPSVTPIIGSRTGGHAVTMQYAHADGPNDLALWSRDPADDNSSIFSEAPWEYRVYDPIDNMTVLADWNNDSAYTEVEVTVLEYNPDADQIRFIDNILALYPGFGFSFDGVQLNVAFLGDASFTIGVPTTHFDPPVGETFIEAAFHPDLHSFYVLTTGGPNDTLLLQQLHRNDAAIEEMTLVYEGLEQAQCCDCEMVVGRNRDVYIACGGEILRLGERSGEWAEIDSFAWSRPAQDIAYNDKTDEVIVLSMLERHLLIAPPNLGSEVDPVFEYAIPDIVPPAPEACMAINPATNSIWITTIANPNQLYELIPQQAGTELILIPIVHTLPLAENARCVDFDDRGHLLVTTADGKVREYMEGGANRWIHVPDGWYANLKVGPEFRVARSRSNFDPDVHADHSVYIPLDELPEIGIAHRDCPGDFVSSRTFQPPADGVVDGADLAFLLGEWGPNPGSPADMVTSASFLPPPDGIVDGADLAVLLGGWGECD
jgi:hypothetical protein